jgi:hypothetical protein
MKLIILLTSMKLIILLTFIKLHYSMKLSILLTSMKLHYSMKLIILLTSMKLHYSMKLIILQTLMTSNTHIIPFYTKLSLFIYLLTLFWHFLDQTIEKYSSDRNFHTGSM